MEAIDLDLQCHRGLARVTKTPRLVTSLELKEGADALASGYALCVDAFVPDRANDRAMTSPVQANGIGGDPKRLISVGQFSLHSSCSKQA
jgi:hypothetical protein